MSNSQIEPPDAPVPALGDDPWQKVQPRAHVFGHMCYFQAEVDAARTLERRRHAEEVGKEAGKAYWLGFEQAKRNLPGSLSTAEDLVKVTKERDRWIEREAMACGENASFEELIGILRAQVSAAHTEIARLTSQETP